MELGTKQGFKQSEIGFIPEDWKVENLGNVSDVKTGPFGSALHEKDYVRDGTPIITVEHLSDFGIVHRNLPMVSEDDRQRLKVYSLTLNDIVFSRVGSVDRNSIVSKNEDGWLFSGRLLRIRLNKSKVYPKYLSFHFQQESFKGRIREVAVGQTMASLNTKILKNIEVALPPTLAEQKAIATALSDVDALITSLDQLIQKKEAIKQGAMQELLKPRESWEKTCLVELADNKKSQFDDGDWVESEHIISQGIRLIQTGNIGVGRFIEKGNKKYISEESFIKLNCKEVLIGDLLICRLAEPAGRACVMPDIEEQKVITSVDVSIFRGDESKVNREFLTQMFTTNNWFNKIIEKVGGTTHKRISRGALGKIEIYIPPKKEQDRIAQILSDMDLEITQLQNKKAKYQQIKQGMMQELLTGKTRLI